MDPLLRWLLKVLVYGAACAFLLFATFGIYVAIYIPYSNIQVIQNKAQAGDGDAQRVLGFGYETGRFARHSFGVIPRDGKKALYWYSRSADSGNGEGAFNLARMYEIDGSGNKDQEAFHWYCLSAKYGSAHGARKLSSIYRDGILGQKTNMKLAEYWKTKADNVRF